MNRYPPLDELLPHRAPMQLLQRIVSHDTVRTVCAARFDPPDAALFGETGQGTVPATVGLELIAQAMAVHDGLRRRAEHRPSASRGFLLGSRRLDLLVRSLPTGEEVFVGVEGEESATTDLVRFTGRVWTTLGETLAAGDVTVLEHRPDPV